MVTPSPQFDQIATQVDQIATQQAKSNSTWRDRLRPFGRALLELGVHAAGLIIMLALFRLIEKTIQILWGTEDITFFEYVKLKYLFQAADLCMLFGFLVISGKKFFKALKAE